MKKSFFLATVACIACFLVMPLQLQAQGEWLAQARNGGTQLNYETTEQVPGGGSKTAKVLIDYEKGFLEFSGSAGVDQNLIDIVENPPRAKRVALEAARAYAYFKANEFLNGTNVKDEITVSLGAGGDLGGIVSKGFVRGAFVIEEKFEYLENPNTGKEYPEGTVRLGILLYDKTPSKSLINLYVPVARKQVEKENITDYKPNRDAITVRTNENYTGLIIDARGLNLSPSMFPQIFVEGTDKQSIYGVQKVSDEYISKIGLAAYVKTLDDARQVERMKKDGVTNPLVVKATRAEGFRNKVVTVTRDDAVIIFSANVHSNILNECRVVIVVD